MIAYISNIIGILTDDMVIKRDGMLRSTKRAEEDVQKNEITIRAILDIKKKGNVDAYEKDAVYTLDVFGIKSKDLVSGLQTLSVFNNLLLVGIKDLEKLIERYMPEHAVAEAITPRQAAILETGLQLVNLVSTIDTLLLTLVYVLQGDDLYYKAKKADALTALRKAAPMVRFYLKTQPKKVVKGIENISNEKPISEMDERNDYSHNDKSFKIPANNFTGNPIYHIGAWWEDYKLERNEKRKHEAKLIGLKILALKQTAMSEEAPLNIQEQIKYYEDKQTKLERKIHEYEEG